MQCDLWVVSSLCSVLPLPPISQGTLKSSPLPGLSCPHTRTEDVSSLGFINEVPSSVLAQLEPKT